MLPFSECPVCGGEVVERDVEKLLRGEELSRWSVMPAAMAGVLRFELEGLSPAQPGLYVRLSWELGRRVTLWRSLLRRSSPSAVPRAVRPVR